MEHASAQATVLNLDQYLQAVKGQDQQIESWRKHKEAAVLKQDEVSTQLFSPRAFASLQHSSEERAVSSPFLGDETQSQNLVFGVSKQTDFGLTSKISYTLTHTKLGGVNAQFVPEDDFYDAKPGVELSQNLWRNSLGREVKATRELGMAQQRLTQQQDRAQIVGRMVTAEMVYWKLAMARQLVTARRRIVETAKGLREWAARRSRTGLGDKSDLLQVEAALKGRILELRLAEDEEQTAQRRFNQLRGMDGAAVSETLVEFSLAQMEGRMAALAAPERVDVKVAMTAEELARAAQTASGEKYTPSLDVFAGAALNGHDKDTSGAVSDSFKADHPSWAIGLKFETWIGFDAIKQQRLALAEDVSAAEINTRAKKFAGERDWVDLQARFADAKRRYVMITEMETLQQEKMNNERDRHKRGRTTVFQVIQFESDFASAQILRMQVESELAAIVAESRSFVADEG